MLPAEIKALRQALRLTREQMAARVGATARSIYRWETGDGRPGPYFLRHLRRLQKATAKKGVIHEPVPQPG